MAALGWPMDKAEVQARGETISDDWRVLGQRLIEREGRLLERRVWLQGLNTGRAALMLDYAQGGRGFETAWVSGGAYRTALSFYPGRASLRAVAVNGVEALGSCDAVALTLKALGDPLLQLGERIAANALQPVQPLWCANAQLLYVEGQWLVGWPTGQSQAAPVPAVIADDEAWRLLALSGGTPLALFGEWECGPQLGRWRLLSAWQQDAHSQALSPIWQNQGEMR